MSVPVIDFSAFRNGTEKERKELASRLTNEFKKHGATRLVNHGIAGKSMSYYIPLGDDPIVLANSDLS